MQALLFSTNYFLVPYERDSRCHIILLMLGYLGFAEGYHLFKLFVETEDTFEFV